MTHHVKSHVLPRWVAPRLRPAGAALLVAALSAGCGDDGDAIEIPGEFVVEVPSTPAGRSGPLAELDAYGQGRGAAFDGVVDDERDLDDLVADAWGDGGHGLHRGHDPIESVLVTFLGLGPDGLRLAMEEDGHNLADVAAAQGVSADDLVETLTNSYRHLVEQGVDNGVIAEREVDEWLAEIRVQFENRVYWTG